MPDLNFFSNFSMGGIGTMGKVLLIFFLAILVIGLIGVSIFVIINNKKYKYSIPLWKKIGNNTQRVAFYKAKDYKIGNAGDKLWKVRKIGKFIPPGTDQTAPNEYTHFEREDGEWINISMPDIDEKMQKMNVKYVHQDMRANRIAISNILDKRFTKQSWWEKYGSMVTMVIFYLVVAIAMVVIFYQWGNIVDRTTILLDQIIALQEKLNPTSIIPAIIPLMIMKIRRKRKWDFSKH